MWLIHTTDYTINFVSTEQADTAPFQYAILSHTWGDDEVLYDDIRYGRGKEKKGWYKVMKTCEQARSKNLRWAWVDSCCINKDSSAELSEAINSMWYWYSRAFCCYVYMVDVGDDCPELTDWQNSALKEDDEQQSSQRGFGGRHDEDRWYKEFAASRWFTRGWTLLELLAPSELYFYGREWNLVGEKRRLLNTLHRITRIDPSALMSTDNLSKFATARKMAWAAGRTTTRVEDRAYSLLGIFGISMPLLYGEGQQASIRLQEEIIRKSTDLSIFAWAWAEESCTDLVFANSPDYFKIGARIVKWQTGRPDMPFRLTNRGVSLDGLPCYKKGGEYYASLNCRYEDDFEGGLALILKDPDSNGAHRDAFGENDLLPMGVRYSGAKQARIVVFPDTASHREKLLLRPVNLIRHNSLLYSQPGHLETTKFWIVQADHSTEKFSILHAHPQRTWNLNTGVSCPERLEVRTGHLVSSFEIQGRSSGTKFSVAFEYQSCQRRKAITGRFATEYDSFALVAERIPQVMARATINPLQARKQGVAMAQASVTPCDEIPVGCSVSILPVEQIMGDWVHKIEVAVMHWESRR